ncbi:MAG: aldose 1-epimerase family protein [Chitinophagaceae bacterium]|nr:aldose 1-epimerase family protein [Chitinophagaceae bacterium]
MIQLENEYLKVSINAKGAELNNIYNKTTALEYLWNGDPAFWSKKSPILFPIVGELKEGAYHHNGNTYHLGRHGFARDMEFELTHSDHSSALFSLKSNAETLEKYPFHFTLEIVYSIDENQLCVKYKVHNTGEDTLYFSIGGHPAFRVPLAIGTHYEDYFLSFSHKESAPRWPISKEGLIEAEPLPFLNDTDRLPLSRELFFKDALVFKHLESNEIKLLSSSSRHGLTFHFKGFPYLGIWAFKGADFVCIEPWCGIADSVGSNQHLADKEGINTLKQNDLFERSWSVTTF